MEGALVGVKAGMGGSMKSEKQMGFQTLQFYKSGGKFEKLQISIIKIGW